eukprot:TRINITY_DN338_c0_g1_i1.p1 TRINITY_DN338_c0_g1~~TRINITY_DN338_c0_g1_i1.p1  ORF type:complete len:542 (+),score=113.70 TRINITY_DN338_c0_g1_i1:201-1826(+)
MSRSTSESQVASYSEDETASVGKSSSAESGHSLERSIWRFLTKITFLDRTGMLESDADADMNEMFVFESSLTLLIYLIIAIFLIRGVVMAMYAGPIAQFLAFGLVALYMSVVGIYWATGDFDIFRNLALSGMFVFALLDHVWAGGWKRSGMVMLWGFLAMLLALLYNRRSSYVVWFVLYTSCLVAMALRESNGVGNVTLPHDIQTVSYFFNIYGSTICVFFIICYYKSTVMRQRREIVRAKKAAEQLLNNMLPRRIIQQIKTGQDHIIEEFENVTVFFMDICSFTVLSSTVRPEQMFQFINELWQIVDDIADKYGIYKVETIGDAYMAVAGCPEKCEDHAERMANFSLQVMEKSKKIVCPDGKPLMFRMGFHTGSVVAGIVGYKMPHYSLFGDTVNTASRMESHGLPGFIHVSPTAAEVLQHKFDLQPRGGIEVKGKGRMETFFLLGRSTQTKVMDDAPARLEPQASQDPTGLAFKNIEQISVPGQMTIEAASYPTPNHKANTLPPVESTQTPALKEAPILHKSPSDHLKDTENQLETIDV